MADEDVFGFRREILIMALHYQRAREFLAEDATDDGWEVADAETVVQEAREYYAFALGKIAAHRGISANRSVDRLTEYAWLLGRDDVVAAMDAASYPQYGAPKVRAFGLGLELKWPDTAEMTRMAAGEPCRPGCDEGCGR
ncbi:hypothetical protein [Streptosporangium carneum]|uniref:hypothetical protein n=1 Tax=Streptosporangium carneum TaxID=47481 RepID=UPI0022F2ACB1|nr:hypothetical protein [Streptosporangium carneum]